MPCKENQIRTRGVLVLRKNVPISESAHQIHAYGNDVKPETILMWPLLRKIFRKVTTTGNHQQFRTVPYLGTICAFRLLLKSHIDHIHDGKMYQCDICGKKDKSLGGLTRHIRSHSKVRPYSCELCGKLFRYSKHLFEHKLRHANNRRFKCEICDKRFFTHTEISSHKLIHASDRSFKCKVCGKGFKRPGENDLVHCLI